MEQNLGKKWKDLNFRFNVMGWVDVGCICQTNKKTHAKGQCHRGTVLLKMDPLKKQEPRVSLKLPIGVCATTVHL